MDEEEKDEDVATSTTTLELRSRANQIRTIFPLIARGIGLFGHLTLNPDMLFGLMEVTMKCALLLSWVTERIKQEEQYR